MIISRARSNTSLRRASRARRWTSTLDDSRWTSLGEPYASGLPDTRRGRARLAASACTCCPECADPGWVPLYPSVSGLLIERGSILSHSAIVAREMGIPTIVGIAGLVDTLQTGQVVTMDGGAGVVKVEPG